MTGLLTRTLAAAGQARRRRAAAARLRAELATFTTPSERSELAAIFARHDAGLAETAGSG